MGEIAIRFVLGGLLVSLFALAGEGCHPKTLAGIFGAAPSVALAALPIAYVRHGPTIVTAEARTMMLGAIGFIAYAAACVVVVRQAGLPVWLGSALCWGAWLVTSLGLYWVLEALE